MTQKLYYTDAYMSEFDATVISCEEKDGKFLVCLDKTAFFPEEGGQYADTGVLGEVEVSDVQEKGGIIYHYCSAPLTQGETVHGVIDFEQRYRRMQNHSGEHVVSGIVNRIFGYSNVGFHLGNEDVTIDYNGVLTREQLLDIEREANKVIYDNVNITAYFPSKEELQNLEYRSKKEIDGEIRIVEVDGCDVCACCAPHVRRTGEIGIIKMLDFEHYKGGVRCHMLCGYTALEDYNVKYENVLKISNLFKVKQFETAEAAERVYEQLVNKDREITALKRKLAEKTVESAEKTDGSICLFFEDIEMDALRHAVNMCVDKCGKVCAAFCANADGSYAYCMGSKTVDLRKCSKDINSALNGRGGGQSAMIQGSVKASKEEIEKFFADFNG
ncbi:MAG: hypothetical protein IJB86_08960 [Clostridia bacterium]|nr:hypothetical protein [Clostridia bacterium]